MSSPRDAFGALADPTRRAILDALRVENGVSLTAGELAAQFPHLSRPAVSKHLAVLRDAGLVAVEERGREWHYTLDPRPLAAIYEGWLAAFAPLWDERLARLKRLAEAPRPAGNGARGAIDHLRRAQEAEWSAEERMKARLSRRALLRGSGRARRGGGGRAAGRVRELEGQRRHAAHADQPRADDEHHDRAAAGNAAVPEAARGHRHAAADRAHRRADDGEPLLRRPLRDARAGRRLRARRRRPAARRQPRRRRQARPGVPHAVDLPARAACPAQDWNGSHQSWATTGATTASSTRSDRGRDGLLGRAPTCPSTTGSRRRSRCATAGSARCSRRRIPTAAS